MGFGTGTFGNQGGGSGGGDGGAATSSYKVYTVLLSQEGSNAPTVTVEENTLGGTVVWTVFSDPGYYRGTLTGAFPTNTKFWSPRVALNNNNGDKRFIAIDRLDANSFQMEVLDIDGSAVSLDAFPDIPIEIRVYN